MYFNNSNNFFHGIMFHHFHNGEIHTKGQGSISRDDFYKLINFIGRKNIADADVFFEKFKQNNLRENEVCLTFDDTIKCQIDVALPVLEDLKIKSFFFGGLIHCCQTKNILINILLIMVVGIFQI